MSLVRRHDILLLIHDSLREISLLQLTSMVLHGARSLLSIRGRSTVVYLEP